MFKYKDKIVNIDMLLFSLVIVETGQGVPSPPDGWTAGRHGWLAGDTANVVFRPSPTNISFVIHMCYLLYRRGDNINIFM